MVELNSLNIQLENLRVIFEEEVLKENASMEQIKTLFMQIKDVEKLIAKHKAEGNGIKK
jgi:hypothetical protein